MKAIDRLYEYLESKGVKPTNFEKELGLSNGYLSAMKKREADMGETILKKIIDYCRDINPEWLLTGEGPMLRINAPSTLQESKDSRDLDWCRMLLKEKDAKIEEQAKIIGRLEERLESSQPRFRGSGNIATYGRVDEKPAVTPSVSELPKSPSIHTALKDEQYPHK